MVLEVVFSSGESESQNNADVSKIPIQTLPNPPNLIGFISFG